MKVLLDREAWNALCAAPIDPVNNPKSIMSLIRRELKRLSKDGKVEIVHS